LKTERLARLSAAWSRQLADGGRWQEALTQIERSLSLSDTKDGRDRKQDLLRRLGTALEARFVREYPSMGPVPANTPIVFRGQVQDPVVASMRIAERPVRLENGAFEQRIDPAGADRVPVQAVLASGELIDLAPWGIRYVEEPVAIPALTWSRAPSIDGGRQWRGKLVVGKSSIRITGEAGEADCQLFVGGKAARVDWKGAAFTCQVDLPGIGAHDLSLELRKEGRTPLRSDLQVFALGDPAFDLAPPSRDGDRTAADGYTLLVAVDEWTTAVEARRGGVQLASAIVEPGERLARLDVRLQPGDNGIDVAATNAAGRRSVRRFSITRVASEPARVVDPAEQPVAPPEAGDGSPRILGVFVVDPDGRERAVDRKRRTIVRTGARLRVESNDREARLLLRERELADADLVLGASCSLVELASRCEIRLRNAAGDSESWKVWFVVDDDPPAIEVTAPTGPVGQDVPFRCEGTWADARGIESILVNGVAAEGAESAERGTWRVQLPGISQAGECENNATDRAGNRTRRVWKVAP
jgi:hypothetical protein